MSTKKILLIAGCFLVLALSLFIAFKNIYRYQTVDFLGIEKINTRSNIITGTVYVQNIETMTWEPFEQAKTRIIEKRILAIIERTKAIDKNIDENNSEFYRIIALPTDWMTPEDLKKLDKLNDLSGELRTEKESLESERKKLKEQL